MEGLERGNAEGAEGAEGGIKMTLAEYVEGRIRDLFVEVAGEIGAGAVDWSFRVSGELT